ncbi:hypothetical protein GX586_01400, partial [bacterium]|nr:hypothetical protein [bacterium]
YTFRAIADDAFTLEVKPTNSAAWTTVLSSPAANTNGITGTLALTAGVPHDIRISYVQNGGNACAILLWSSPSTPEEVIDPVTFHGLNAASYVKICFADITKVARWTSGGSFDENGWPGRDAGIFIAEGMDFASGTYRFQFNGKARVVTDNSTTFTVDGSQYVNTLPSGIGYDPASNVTSALMRRNSSSSSTVRFFDSSRDGSTVTNTGVTNVRFMRPLVPGTDVPHEADAVSYAPFRNAMSVYTCLRWLEVANVQPAYGNWASRTKPAHMKFSTSVNSTNAGECWEYLIMLANEAGKDLYITTPVQADNEYFTKLALLCKYGSDGNEPYSSYQSNPSYPPLNPNLRLYLEVGNEIWNWGFGSTQYAQDQSYWEAQNNTPDGVMISYDGYKGKGIYLVRRWLAVRTVRASDAFRAVFGDAAMHRRIRPLLEYQYDNAQETARRTFQIMEEYFNNGAGNFVTNPRPAHYYLYGSGGATYYGVGNNWGTQTNIVFPDPSFSVPRIADGAAQAGPTGGFWSFSGNAGLYRNASAAVSMQQLGVSRTAATHNGMGMKFRTGATPIHLYELGRWLPSACTQGHTVQVVRASDKMPVAVARPIASQDFVARRPDMFRYARLPAPVALDADTEYYIVSEEFPSGDKFYWTNTIVAACDEITVLGGAAVNFNGTPANPSAWTITETPGAGLCFGPVSFKYSTSPAVTFTPYRNPAFDDQAAFIIGTGSFSSAVHFAQTGDFAIAFMAAGAGGYWPGYAAFDIYVDSMLVSPYGQADMRVGSGGSSLGGWNRRTDNFEEFWGSAVFRITNAGQHTVRFAGRTASTNYTIFDTFSISSVDAIMESGFGAGSAYGQVAQANYANQLNNQARYAKAFGLEVIAYEAGWSLGGDFWAQPIQTYAKFADRRARSINNQAMDIFTESGGHLNVWGVYSYFPEYDAAHSMEYPLEQSLMDLSGRLRAEDTNGIPVPATLLPSGVVRWAWNGPGLDGLLTPAGIWASWTILCPASGSYAVEPHVRSGAFALDVDGVRLASGDASAVSGSVHRIMLTKGVHGVRLVGASVTNRFAKVLVYRLESVESPTFAPAPGTYPSALVVTMSTATAGAAIRYTTDGTTPTTNTGSAYQGPVDVAANTMFTARAFREAMEDSPAVTARFFISSLAISTVTLPPATAGVAYAAALAAGGGAEPYAWDIADGALPPGLDLAEDGMIAGTPFGEGTNNFTACVTDALGASVSRQFLLAVLPEPAAALCACALILARRFTM